MGRGKLFRFEQNRHASNVIESGKDLFTQLKGHWRPDYFQNENPIILELACGKGEYTVGLGRLHPEANYIGIDKKGDRIARGSQMALSENLSNVAFLRTDIRLLDQFFDAEEVDEIWITFPDPQPKQDKNRLTHPHFLSLYRHILKPDGILHLKTDSTDFFNYSVDMLNDNQFKINELTHNLYTSELNIRHYGIKTKYEEMFTAKGYLIKYLESKKAV